MFTTPPLHGQAGIRSIACMIFIVLAGFSTARAQVNPEYLIRDEGLGADRIGLVFSEVCSPGTDSRTMGLGIDMIRFLDEGGQEVFLVDVGNPTYRQWLGEGWYGDETWGDGRTVCWTQGLAGLTMVNCPVPPTARTMQFIATIPPCVTSITTGVTVNGEAVGSFVVNGSTGWFPQAVTLPYPVKDALSFRLEQGGPLALEAIDWIDGQGQMSETDPLNLDLIDPGDEATLRIQAPSDAGDFQIRLASPCPTASTLRLEINGLSIYGFEIPAGTVSFGTFVPDALERQADRRTVDDGWGESFNGSAAFDSWLTPGPGTPPVTWTYDTMTASLPEGQSIFYLRFSMPTPVVIEDFSYLSLRLKVTSGMMYYIRPAGLNASGQPVAIWHESAATDDRVGTGEWETLTIDLKELAAESGTSGVSVKEIVMPVQKYNEMEPGTIVLDWIRIHDAFAPNSADVTTAEVLGDHLDNDLDGLVDAQDAGDAHGAYFERPMVIAHYHPWYGSPFSTTGHWGGWYAEQADYSGTGEDPVPPTGVVYDPDDYVEGWPGKRNLGPFWYPLKYWEFPDYVAPADGQYRYDIYGGVEQHDSLNPEFVQREVALAARYGIDGFAADTGGPGSLVGQIKTTLAATLTLDKPFLMTVLYDWYYKLAAWGLEEKEDYQIALDIRYMLGEYASHPNWWHYQGWPVLTAPFLSHLVAADKWLRIARIVVDPSISDFEGAIELPERLEGFGNVATFTFAKAEKPSNGDPRILSVRFKYIEFLDVDFNRVGYLDVGHPSIRQHLLGGWSGDEGDPEAIDDQTWVWAAGIEREASLEMEIPGNAVFINIHCYSLMADNSMTVSLNASQPVGIALKTSPTGYIFRLRDAGDPFVDPAPGELPEAWPFALFMDHKAAAPYFDGYASYGAYLSSNRVIISQTGPTILTVGVGYDDRKIRVPGSFTDREDGVLYRRHWETALSLDPDLVLINTWNEWPESTNISPTVEFGFQYLELTLTYSLMFKKQLTASDLPSTMDLTVRRYDVDGQGNVAIRLTSGQAGQVTFSGLPLEKIVPGSWVVTRDGSPYAQYEIDEAAGAFVLTLAGGGEYVIESASSNAVGHLECWLSMQ